LVVTFGWVFLMHLGAFMAEKTPSWTWAWLAGHWQWMTLPGLASYVISLLYLMEQERQEASPQ
jgi:hypothetical protein